MQIIDEIKHLTEVKDTLPVSLVKYYAYFYENDRFYFVMDYLDSPNLELVIEKYKRKKKPIYESKILEFGLQILDALVFIHSRQIIHRDLRPKLVDMYWNYQLTITWNWM